MKLVIRTDALLEPLKLVINVVEQRQVLPILSHVLFRIKDKNLQITATDAEIELVGETILEHPADEPMEFTLPGRKLMDICRSLPEEALVQITLEKEWAIVQSGHSRFTLATLPANGFPAVTLSDEATVFSLPEKALRFLVERTYFAIAQQDVRLFLNGMLLETKGNTLSTVATDAHRLAFNTIELPKTTPTPDPARVIVPRKAVVELMRLLEDAETPVMLSISKNHIRAESPCFAFTATLLNAEYPDYRKLLPEAGDKRILVDCDKFKQALTRAAILANEKLRNVRLQLRDALLHIFAHNPEHEAAEDKITIDYKGEQLDIGFNINYLLDVLSIVNCKQLELTLSTPKGSVLIKEPESNDRSLFVVMPVEI